MNKTKKYNTVLIFIMFSLVGFLMFGFAGYKWQIEANWCEHAGLKAIAELQSRKFFMISISFGAMALFFGILNRRNNK